MALALMPARGLADEAAAAASPASDAASTLCGAVDESAATYSLPVAFFARLIWKESRFKPDAVSHKGAQGIAQFMPKTAAIRNVANAFDPAEAIPASARYLRELADRFGNLGLAAAAYNGGEQRVANWIAGSGGLATETRDYVAFITGHTAEEWRATPTLEDTAFPDDDASPPGCNDIVALLAKGGASAASAQILTAAVPPQPWGVQLAGGFSEARTRAAYAALQRLYPDLLAGRTPVVLSGVYRSRGSAPFYVLRLAYATRPEADAMCNQLLAAGGACTVMRNTTP